MTGAQTATSRASAPRRTAIVSFTSVTFDSRIRRLVRLLAEAGDEIGLLSADPAMPDGLPLASHVPLPAFGASRADVVRQIAAALPARVGRGLTLRSHLLLPSSRAAAAGLAAFRPQLIIAADWATLPVSADAARRFGARLVYDSHEVAVDEHAHLAWWRLLMRPHVEAVEGSLIAAAEHVITVGEGVAAALRARYPGVPRIDVIRNLPETRAAVARPAGEPPMLIYAGLISAERRLDAMIGALALVRAPWRLTIMGFGRESAIAPLKQQAQDLGVASRVTWREAAAPERLVEALADADVGLFLSDGAGPQQTAALPNKVFEYAAAGLGLIASGSADVASLVARHGHGRFLAEASARALAEALDALDGRTLSGWKDRAIRLAEQENWTIEGAKLLAILRGIGAG
jgi:glycogen synthase